jgi:hypothetical protein
MSQVVRDLIEKTLSGMEQGEFQDFCLHFLPLYAQRFGGIVRVGHTAAGKTRKGTPDLLKTDATGAQLAVQCGTEKNYWKRTEKLDDWKPCDDGTKCIESLSNLAEIVIIANREIPTNHPNCKTVVIKYLSSKTSAAVTPLSVEDIGQFLAPLVHDLSVRSLFKDYFPEVFSLVQDEELAQKYRLADEVAAERSINAEMLLELVENAFGSHAHIGDVKSYVIERIDELSSSYRLTPVPAFSGISRQSVTALPLAEPLGKVFELAGVPKIGKSSSLLQLAREWEGSEVHWYDCPIHPTLSEECSHSIAEDLIRTLLPEAKTELLVRSPYKLATALKATGMPAGSAIFVVDNANNLPEAGLKQLRQILGFIKASPLVGGIAFIFVSTRKLHAI